MIRPAAIVLLVLYFTGCGETRPAPAALQRFQALRPQLSSATRESEVLQSDVRILESRIQADDQDGSRAAAVKLRRDARVSARIAAATAGAVSRITTREHNRIVRRYFVLIVQGLRWDRLEAQTLQPLSEVVWQDPLMQSSPTAGRVARLQGNARWSAWQALQSLDKAAALRSAHRAAFRYVPVHH